MVEAVLLYLWLAFSSTLFQVLVLLGPGLILTVILNYETVYIQGRAIETIGRGWYLGLFGWLGTVVHELGHAFFCLVFGHKITDIKLFHLDSQTGTLGYVKHSYKPGNIYQLSGNFFIGIGPILLGTAVIFLIAYFLLGINAFNSGSSFNLTGVQINSWEFLGKLLQNLGYSVSRLLVEIFSWQHLTGWQLYIFLYLAFAIGSSVTLSPPDIKAALGGFIVLVALVFILNLATVWAGSSISNFVVLISGYNVLFYAVIFLILLINLVMALLIFLPVYLLQRNRTGAEKGKEK
jgi:hypothetical protein